MSRRPRRRAATPERLDILGFLDTYGPLTTAQIALQRDRGNSATAAHLEILRSLGYVRRNRMGFEVEHGARGARRLGYPYTITDRGRELLATARTQAVADQSATAKELADFDVLDSLLRLARDRWVTALADDTGRTSDEVRTALERLSKLARKGHN